MLLMTIQISGRNCQKNNYKQTASYEIQTIILWYNVHFDQDGQKKHGRGNTEKILTLVGMKLLIENLKARR
jgi:hypothetical protein